MSKVIPKHHVEKFRRFAQLIRAPWLLPIVALAALVRFFDLTKSAIWHDEGFSLMLSLRSPSAIWAGSARDVHPPLYYLLLHGWQNLFGNSILAVRTMSALAGVGVVILGVWLVRLVATRRAAILAGIFLALMPIAVRYSQEVRMYGILGLWLLGATIALVYWVQNPQRDRYLVVYALLMAAGLYTHYFAILALAAHWLYLLILWQRKKPISQQYATRANWLLANCVIVFLFLPWIPNLIAQLTRGQGIAWIPPVNLYTLPSAVWQFSTFTSGRSVPWPLYILLPLIILIVSVLFIQRDRSKYKFDSLIVIYTFLPILATFVVSIAKPVFIERYLVFAAIGIPLILGIVLDRFERRYRTLAVVAVVVVIGVELIGLSNVYGQANHQMNVVADYLNQNYKSGDVIISGELYTYFDFSYYNNTGSTALLYTPPHANGTPNHPNGYGESGLLYQNAATIYLDSYRDIPNDPARIWVVGKPGPQSYFNQVPYYWQEISEKQAGDSEVRLYYTR